MDVKINRNLGRILLAILLLLTPGNCGDSDDNKTPHEIAQNRRQTTDS